LVAALDGAGPDDPERVRAGTFPGGVALSDGRQAWVLVEEDAGQALGRALAWTERQGLDPLHLLAGDGSGVLARRARLFTDPPRVWLVDGRAVRAAEADRHTEALAPPEAALDLVPVLSATGLEIVIEHGRVRGEVLGLEVAAIVVDDEGTARVEIGVGRHDREAFALVHGDVPTEAALTDVVETVRRHRLPGSGHPLGRLAPERWLRTVLLGEPALVGAASLEPIEAALPRISVKDAAPAFALGTDVAGEPIVVACSIGIDLDLVPAAADTRAMHAPEARLLLAVPTRDDHPVTRRLAQRLVRPADILRVDDSFRA
jgi:hypothetical protein